MIVPAVSPVRVVLVTVTVRPAVLSFWSSMESCVLPWGSEIAKFPWMPAVVLLLSPTWTVSIPWLISVVVARAKRPGSLGVLSTP